MRELFFTREHARQLVLWTDPTESGPAFGALRRQGGTVDTVALARAIRAPVRSVVNADLVRLFRTHPDGWAAFYATFPGAPGLVEIERPTWTGDSLATVVIGRACGEHCVNAWRVTVRGGRVIATDPLRIPKL